MFYPINGFILNLKKESFWLWKWKFGGRTFKLKRPRLRKENHFSPKDSLKESKDSDDSLNGILKVFSDTERGESCKKQLAGFEMIHLTESFRLLLKLIYLRLHWESSRDSLKNVSVLWQFPFCFEESSKFMWVRHIRILPLTEKGRFNPDGECRCWKTLSNNHRLTFHIPLNKQI